MLGTAGEVRTFSYGLLRMDTQVLDIHKICADTRYSLEDLPGAISTNGESMYHSFACYQQDLIGLDISTTVVYSMPNHLYTNK